MRVPILLLGIALSTQVVHAQALSNADRAALLGNLDKMREEAESVLDGRYRLAVSAYRNALSSEDATMDLYLKCYEKVNFEDQKKKAMDFREWKRTEGEKMADPAFRTALRHQLRWLILSLQAASLNPDRAKLSADAMQAVDAIFADARSLKGQGQLLGQAVTGTVFARAYDIRNVKADGWSFSPVDLASIYDKTVMPPLRNAAHLGTLRSAWTKRIQQETIKQEFLDTRRREENRREEGGKNNRRDDEEQQRIGMADAMQSPEYQKFLDEELPKLQWEMEVDLYKAGDETGAANRMLAFLQKNVRHPSSREWADQLKTLLTPNPAPVTTTP